MIEMMLGSVYLLDDAPQYLPSGDLQDDASADSRPERSRILVVDDERLIADTICEILKSAGFEVAVAYDGWDAIEKAARFKPDQLLTDVMMPQMDGIELAISMRKIYPALRIFLFSAHAAVSEMVMGATRRGFHFELLSKPLHPSELVMRLKEK